MDATHLHLLINHVPVFGTIFGVLVLAYGLARKQQAVMQVALGLFVLAGVAAVGAYLSGEGAEDLLEQTLGFSELYLEPHEDAGFYALLAASVLGVFALGGLVFFRRALPKALVLVMLVLGLGVSSLMAWTANLGGQITHTEIRADAPAQPDDSETAARPAGGEQDNEN